MATLKKSPPELVERFAAALPAHPDLVRKPMFGYPAAFVHGNMVCGLFQDCLPNHGARAGPKSGTLSLRIPSTRARS